jgi:hypothetical protein
VTTIWTTGRALSRRTVGFGVTLPHPITPPDGEEPTPLAPPNGGARGVGVGPETTVPGAATAGAGAGSTV